MLCQQKAKPTHFLALLLELGNLTNLRDLNVMNNKLEWLPWQLCNCLSLKILSLDGNAVQKIPRQLMTHQGLAELYASGNKLCTLPQGKFATLLNPYTANCVVPENIHTPPTEYFLVSTPQLSGNSSFASYFLLKCFCFLGPPSPLEFPWVWIFSGFAHPSLAILDYRWEEIYSTADT